MSSKKRKHKPKGKTYTLDEAREIVKRKNKPPRVADENKRKRAQRLKRNKSEIA